MYNLSDLITYRTTLPLRDEAISMGGLLNKAIDIIDVTEQYQYDSYDENDCALTSRGGTTNWPQTIKLKILLVYFSSVHTVIAGKHQMISFHTF